MSRVQLQAIPLCLNFVVSFQGDVSCGLSYLGLQVVAEAMGDLGVTLAINNKVALCDTSNSIDACNLEFVQIQYCCGTNGLKKPSA